MNALERGAGYLALKPRTRKEVTDYLKGKGYPDEEVEQAVRELCEYHYIDDGQYTRLYIRYASDKGRGMSRIRRELLSKGVDSDTIEDVLYELEQEEGLPDQMSMALEIGEAVLGDADVRSLDYAEKSKLKGRIARRLQSRGFSNDVIFSVLNRLSL